MPKSSAYIDVICPTCGKVYEIKLEWKGNGTPRIRCKQCKARIQNINDIKYYIEA